jgi:hypothetical protein
MHEAATSFDRRLRRGLSEAEIDAVEGLLDRLHSNVAEGAVADPTVTEGAVAD